MLGVVPIGVIPLRAAVPVVSPQVAAASVRRSLGALAQPAVAADRCARKIVAFVRLFTRGGVALQEPCMNRDTRAEWLA